MPDTTSFRIVHIVRSPIGGIFRHIVDLARGQAEAGHMVGIILDSTTGDLMSDRAIAAVTPHLALGLHRMPMARPPGPADMLAVWKLFGLLRSLNADVLHGHGAKGGAYARVVGSWLGLVGKKPLRIYCPHGGSLHYDPATVQGRVQYAIERALARATDGFVFVSHYEERSFRDHVTVPMVPVRRVFNGLRAVEFDELTPAPQATDLLFIGMMRELKGVHVLLKALARLASERGLYPTLTLVGEGDDRSAFQQLAVDLGLASQVRFLPPTPTRDALALGRVLIVPSLAESMPYIVIEAIAAAVPVIATRVGGIPEIFGEQAGSLVEAGNVDALANAIAGTLADPGAAAAVTRSVRLTARSVFSVEHMVANILEFYDDLLRPRRDIPSSQSVLRKSPASRYPSQ